MLYFIYYLNKNKCLMHKQKGVYDNKPSVTSLFKNTLMIRLGKRSDKGWQLKLFSNRFYVAQKIGKSLEFADQKYHL